MKFWLRKATSLSLLFSATYVCRVDAAYSAFSELQQKVALLEEKVNELTKSNALETTGGVNASGYPSLVEAKHFYLFVDPMLLHSKVEGTEFAYAATGPTSSLPIRADTKNVPFGWDFGIRVGAGYHFPAKDWNLDASFTWIDTHESASISSNMMGSIMPLKGIIQFGEGVTKAKSSFSIQQDTILVKLSKSYFVSSSVSLTPYGGLKNSWIHLKQWTQYYGGSVLGQNDIHVKDGSRFWGIGPSVGNQAKLYLGKGFSLDGDLQVALQYGLFLVSYSEKQSNLPQSSILIKDSFHQFAPNFEIDLGASYSSYFNHKRNFFTLSMAYQVQYWMNQNQFLDITQPYARRYVNLAEDMSFHGLIVNVRVDF
jgi:hypothetical protein